MTEGQQDALIGRVVRELKSKKDRLGVLQTEAQQLGKDIIEVGRRLVDGPHSLIGSGESFNPEFVGPHPLTINAQCLNSERIMLLAKEIRQCMLEIAELEKQKKLLGI